MAAVELATAFIALVPETRRVAPETRKAFRNVDPIATAAGRRHGGQYSKGFGSAFQSKMASFLLLDATIRRLSGSLSNMAQSYMRSAAAIATGLTVAAHLTGRLSRSLLMSTSLLRRMAGVGLAKLAVGLRVVAQVAERVAREIARVTSAFLVLMTITRVVGIMNRLGKAMAVVTMGSAVALGAVAALATTVSGPLVAALSVAASAAGAMAGAIVGVLAPAIASLTMGFSGLSQGAQAYNKIFTTAPKSVKPIDTSSEIKAIERANKGLVSAEKDVAKAKKNSEDAERDLIQARKDAADQIDDLNRSLKDASLSEQDAKLSVLEARRDLANEEYDDPLDRQRAVLRVAEAEQRLANVQQDNKDLREEVDAANRAGVNGSELVANAQERVADAHERVADAEQGVVDAQEAIADAHKSLQDKLAGGSGIEEALSPDESFYAMIGQRLAPVLEAYRNLKHAVTDEFSAALVPAFDMLGGFLTRFQPNLVALTGILGQVGVELTESLTSPAAVGAFESMTESSGAFFAALAEGENGLGGFLTGLAQFSATAAGVASGWGPGLNDTLLTLGERLRNVSAEQITETFQTFEDMMYNIGQVVGPVIDLFQRLGPIAAEGLAPGFSAVGQALRDSLPGLERIAETLMPALGEVMANLAPVLPVLVGVFTPWAQVLAVLAPVLADVVAFLAPLAPMVTLMAIAFKVMTTAITLYNAAMLILSARTKIATVVTRIFNAVLRMNPIGIIITALTLLATGLYLFFTNTEKGREIWAVVWAGIKTAFAATWEFLKGAWEWILNALDWIGEKLLWLWQNVMVPAWNGIKAAFSVFWEYAQVAFQGFQTVLGVIGDVLMWVWKNVMVPAFKGIATAINIFWIAAQVTFALFQAGLRAVGAVISWLWRNVGDPIFTAMGVGIRWVWDNVISPTFDLFRAGIDVLGKVFKWLWENVVKPVWDALGDGIKWVIDTIVLPAFEVLKDALSGVWDFFKTVVDGIRDAWDAIRSAVAKPVNFIIESVWNNGLVKAWNTVAEWLPGLDEAKPLIPVGYAAGGSVTGGKQGKDSVPALLMPKEHVWDVKSVAAAGGQDVMYAMRNLIKRGIPFSWDAVSGLMGARPSVVDAIATAPANADMAGFLAGIVPGFQDGGEVRPAWEYQLEHGHKIAKARNGNPYTWGFEDCSGYLSMIADGIINGTFGVRNWATGSFPGTQPWVRGLGEGFSVGVHDNPGGPGGGHAAGTLTGVGSFATVNVESGGAHGRVAYGGPAAGADSPQWDGKSPGRFHLAIGADGAFVSGGMGGGSGSSVSPVDQMSYLEQKLANAIDLFMLPIRQQLPTPPPVMLGVPGRALDITRDTAVQVGSDIIGGLGSGLRTVFEGAGSVVNSVFRDTGGFIPNGLTLVRNETGKPEAVLNWEQLNQVKQLMSEGKTFLDAVREVNVAEPEAEEVARANRELGPDTSEIEVGSMAYAQRMTSVTASTTKEFMGKVGQIIGESLWDIFDPGFGIDPVAIADRYTIKADEDDGSKTKKDDDKEIKPYDSSLPGSTDMSVTPNPVAEQEVREDTSGEIPGTGRDNYVSNFAKAAKDKGLGIDAAIIAVGAGLVETQLKMYANKKVPESLNLPHDAVGEDHDSVGILQQRPHWGPIETLMNAYGSSGLFYDKLMTFNWAAMPPGDAAQKVQVSAYPGKYAERMAEAEELLKGKFDSGGMIPPGLSIIENRTRTYEPAAVFNPEQWTTLTELAEGGGGGIDQRLIIENLTVGDWREAQRELKNIGTRHQMRYAGRPKA